MAYFTKILNVLCIKVKLICLNYFLWFTLVLKLEASAYVQGGGGGGGGVEGDSDTLPPPPWHRAYSIVGSSRDSE